MYSYCTVLLYEPTEECSLSIFKSKNKLKVYTTEYCVVCIVTSVNGTVESGSYFLRVVFKNNFEFFTEMFDNLSCESGNIQAIQMLLITSWEATDDLLNMYYYSWSRSRLKRLGSTTLQEIT